MKSKSDIKTASAKNKPNAELHLLFHDNPLPMWIYDLETLSFLDVNEAAVDHYGYSRDEFLKMRIIDIHSKEDVPLVKKQVQAKRSRLQYSGERRHCKKDGSIIYVKITSRKLTYEGRKAVMVVVNDITENKLTHQALTESEERYRNLVDDALVGVYQTTLKGEILYVNSVAAKIAGFKSPKAVTASGSVLLRYKDPSDRKKFIEALKKDGKANNFEAQMLTRSGESKWVSLSATLEGDVISGFLRDMTGRKMIDESLKASEEKYRSLIEQIPTVVYINPVDAPTVTIFISPQIKTILGYTPEEWLADRRLWEKSLHPEDHQRALSEAESINSNLEDNISEYRMIARDGRVLWIRDQVALIRDADGKPKFWQGLMTDITEHKHSEGAQREAEAKYRDLIELLPVVVYTSELSAIGRWYYVGPQIESLLGYTPDEWLADPNLWYKHVHPDDRDRQEALEEQAYARGEPFSAEYRMQTRDGRELWIRDTAQIIPPRKGEPPIVQGVLVDITDQKQAEAELEQSHSLLQAAFDSTADGLLVVNANGRITSFNQKFVEMWRIPESVMATHDDDQTIAFVLDQLKKPQDFVDKVKELYAHPEANSFDILEFKDGRIFERYSQPQHLGEKIEGRVWSFRDVTARQRAEEALSASEAELNAIVASMPDVILVLDKDGRYLKIAPTNPNLLHMAAEAMLGKRMHEVFSSQKADELVGYIREALAKKETIHFEYALLIEDRIVWFSGTASPLTDDSVVWVGRDITERKKSENLLQQRLADLSKIYDASQRLHEILGPEILADELISLLKGILHYDHGSVLLVEPTTGNLFPFAVSDEGLWFTSLQEYKDYLAAHQLGLGIGITGWVAQHGKSVCIGDVKKDPRYIPTSDSARSELCIPLIAGNSVIGVVNLESTNRNAYTESDQRLLETIAAQMAIAIQNVRLYEDTVQRNNELKALHESGLMLGKSLDPKEIGEKVVSVLSEWLNWHHAAVRVRRGESDDVELLAFSQTDSKGQTEKVDTGRLMAGKAIIKVGQGMSGWVIKHGRMINSGDLENDPRYHPTFQGMKSGLHIPIWAGGRAMGCISVESEQPNAFKESDERLLTTLASQTASALENARLFTEAQNRIKELEALNRASQALTGTLDLAPLLENILQSAKEAITGAEKGTILLKGKGEDYLHMTTQIGYEDARIMRLPFQTKRGYSGKAFHEKRPILIDDASEFSLPFDEDVDEVNAIKSGIVAPLVVKDEAIGVIALDNATKKFAFTQNDLDLLTIFASSAASVIENSRLFEETRHRAEEFSSLYETARDISSEHDLNKVLGIVAERAASLLHTSIIGIYLYDRERNDVYVAVSKGFESSSGVRLQMGEGLAGLVAQSRQPFVIDDYQIWENRSSKYSDTKLRAVLGVPMLYGGDLIGVLTADEVGDSERKFTEEDEHLLSLFASNAASVVHNARLLAETQHRAEEFSYLYETARYISNEQDLNPLLQTIVQRAADMLHAPDGGMYLYDAESKTLQMPVELKSIAPTGTRLKMGEGAAGKAALIREPVIIDDYQTWEGHSPQFKDTSFRAVLAVPMIYSGELIGVLVMDEIGDSERKFVEADASLLSLLASQAAGALHNARLLAETQRRAEEFSYLYETARYISNEPDLNPLLQTIVQRAYEMLHTADGGIALYDAESKTLEIVADAKDSAQIGYRLNLGEGLAGKVAQTRESLIIADYQTWEGKSPRYQNTRFRAALEVPMLYGGDLIGVLFVNESDDSERKFSEVDERLLSLLASQAAGAIHNAGLLGQARRRAEEFEALYQTAANVSAQTDVKTVLSTILKRARSLSGASGAALYLFDPERDDLELVATQDDPYLQVGTRLQLGEGLSGKVAQTQQPFIVADYHNWENRSPQYKDLPYASVLGIPMLYSGELLGVLTMHQIVGATGEPSPKKFSEQDINLLSLFANAAAGAVYSAHLLERSQRRAEEFEALYQTAANVSAQTDVKTVLNTITERARSLSGASGAGLYLMDPERSYLELVASIDPDIRVGTRLALGEGLAGRVAQTNQALIVNNYQNWAHISAQYKGLPITSVLGIPMLYNGQLIGVLNVHNRVNPDQTRPERIFNEQDVSLLSLFANAAAGAVYSARLLEQTRNRLNELSALAETSAALRSATTRSEMISVIMEQLMLALKAEGANLVSTIPGRAELFIEDARGCEASIAGMWIPAGEGLSSHVITSGKAYTTPDVRTDPRLFRPDLKKDTRAIAIVPLRSQDKIIGVISISRAEKNGILPPPFSESDTRLLVSIADMAANALQRHSLHEETTRYAEQLVVINNLGRGLSESLDLPHIYEKLSRSALDLLPDSATVSISLLDAQASSFAVVYGLQDGVPINVAALHPIPFDRASKGSQDQAIYDGKPLIVPDLSESPKGIGAVVKGNSQERYTQSGVYVPMKAEGRVIGVLQLQSYIKDRYTLSDAKLLELVANTAAVAIQNARLFTQLKRRLDQLSALHSVDTAISSTTDLRISLQSVLENVSRELKIDAADVLILNSATLTLQYSTDIGFFTPEITHSSLPLGKGQAGLAALERRVIRISNLSEANIGLAHANLVTDERFVSYAAVPLMAKGEVKGVLEIFHRSLLELDDDWMSFLEMLANQAALAIDNSMLFEGMERVNTELSMAYEATIEGWSQALELRDQETQGHSMRVLDLTLHLAAEMGISGQALQDIRRGVLLHDIGKMGIPDSILHKPGKLTDEEWEIMRMHPQYAYNMLIPITYLRNSLDIPYSHHEKWDGTGYPRGLSGEAIPLTARIFCIVDVYDALTSDRPYREAWSKEKTLDYIREQTGKHFDPRIAEAFFNLMRE